MEIPHNILEFATAFAVTTRQFIDKGVTSCEWGRYLLQLLAMVGLRVTGNSIANFWYFEMNVIDIAKDNSSYIELVGCHSSL